MAGDLTTQGTPVRRGVRWRLGPVLAGAGYTLLLAFLAVVVLASRAVAAPLYQGAAPVITFVTQPDPAEIVVREEPAKAIVEVKDAAGRPLRDVLLELEIDTPPRGTFISTDLPRVDGTPLVRSRLAAPQGSVELDVIWPMRGTYQVRVTASPAPGTSASFQRTTRTFAVSLPERPGPMRNFFITAVILLAFGAGGGYVLGRANHAGRPA